MRNLALHNASRTEEREVTLLFSDLRRSTALATSLDMDRLACEMLGHVMDCLTEAVLDHDGIVVDYYGDGLVAMWNAPADQAEHVELACRAGLAMLDTLPDLTRDWIGLTQRELRLGIGVHTGIVQVGNAGSTRQAKYGPRGPTVHVASRVEAATKEVGMPIVATEATVKQLCNALLADRVCRAKLDGLRQPINLYAICLAHRDAQISAAWRIYDCALRQFELGQFEQAAESLATIKPNTIDVPLRFLSQQIQRELGCKQRRRSTDRPSAHNGVIPLCAKSSRP